MMIKISEVVDGATVEFDYDSRLVASLKETFPKARWSGTRKHWHVPGRLAHRRLVKWEAEQTAALPTADDEQRARDALAFSPIKSPLVALDHTGLTLATPYSEKLVEVLKKLPGARWSHKREDGRGVWQLPCSSADALRAALPGMEIECDRLNAEAVARRKAHEDQKAADRARWAAEREAQDAAHAERRAARIVVMLDEAPAEGAALRRGGGVVVVTGFGKPFRVDEDMASVWGSHFLGREGERCCYAYTRRANEVERNALEAQELAAAQAAVARAAQAAAILAARRLVVQEGRRPEASDPAPHGGELLHHHRADLAVFGGGERVILAPDGALWLVRGNGADGDDWSLSDQSGGIGYRIPPGPRAEAMAEQFRALEQGR